jgi:hypothetical protein
MASERTFFDHISLNAFFTGTGEQIFVFNDPSDSNAFQKLDPRDGTSLLDVNQSFNCLRIMNTHPSNAFYVSWSKEIAASNTASDQVLPILPKTVLTLEIPFVALRIFSVASGPIYFSAFLRPLPYLI